MGDIMQTITAGQLADKIGVSRPTMEKRVRRTFPDISPALSAPLSVEQVRVLSAGRVGKKSVRKSAPVARKVSATVKENLTTETTEEKADMAQPAPLFNPAYLKAIIYGHAVLIFADLVILYSVPGAIAGLLVGFFMHSAVALADRPELNRTSAFALWICFGLDGLAWFVHVPAFRDSVSADVSDHVTQFLAGVVCAMSFAALYALRDSKLD